MSEACAYDSPNDCSPNSINGVIGSQLLAPASGEKEAVTPVSDIPSLCDLPEAKAQTDIKVSDSFLSPFISLIVTI